MSVEAFNMERTTTEDSAMLADVEAIGRLWSIVGDSKELKIDAETTRQMMTGLDYGVVRDASGGIVGAVSVYDCKRGLFKIESLAVEEQSRGKGFGAMLAKYALETALGKNAKTVMAYASPDSVNIFSRLGFYEYEQKDLGGASMFYDVKN